MASAAFQKAFIFHENRIQNRSRNRTRIGIAFQTLFFDISGDLRKKWEPKLEPDFRKNRSRKGMDFRTRFRKGEEGLGKANGARGRSGVILREEGRGSSLP